MLVEVASILPPQPNIWADRNKEFECRSWLEELNNPERALFQARALTYNDIRGSEILSRIPFLYGSPYAGFIEPWAHLG